LRLDVNAKPRNGKGGDERAVFKLVKRCCRAGQPCVVGDLKTTDGGEWDFDACKHWFDPLLIASDIDTYQWQAILSTRKMIFENYSLQSTAQHWHSRLYISTAKAPDWTANGWAGFLFDISQHAQHGQRRAALPVQHCSAATLAGAGGVKAKACAPRRAAVLYMC
jgi:hypothetical protein